MKVCSKPECKGEETGKCLEGFKLEECPFFKENAAIPPTLNSSNTSISQEGTDVLGTTDLSEHEYIYTATKLNVEDANTILRSAPANVVILAGATWSGKTTLYARIGELFEQGQFENYNFAGSRTLVAQSQISWLAMCESGNDSPDTERTKSLEDDQYLHFRVRVADNSKPSKNVLLGDISGESFEKACTSLAKCSSFSALKRADHLVIFFDGSKLAISSERGIIRRNTITFLRSIVQVGQMNPRSLLHIVFSKYDKIVQGGASVEQFVETIESEIRALKIPASKLRFWRLAVRSTGSYPATTDKIKEIFECWVEDSHLFDALNPETHFDSERDFCRFGITELSLK